MKHLHLQNHAEKHAELRRAMGFRYPQASSVRQFVQFLESQDSSGPIRAAMVLEWAMSASPRCGRSGQIHRLTAARQFLIYLKAFLPDVEIPPPGPLAKERQPRPYLYSSPEIVRMQRATRRLWEPESLKQITFETLIGLLASTGLRIGEALRLIKGARSPSGFRPPAPGDPQHQGRQVPVRAGSPHDCPAPAALYR